jgi:cell division septal protein FtsQ
MTLQQRVRRRRLRRFLKILLIFAAISGLAGAMWAFFFSNLFRISNLEVVGVETLDENTIKKSLEDAMKGKLLGIFPKNHPLFINENLLAAHLQEEFPKIAAVSFRYQFGNHTLRVLLKERKSIGHWCRSLQEGDENVCFLVDSQAVIFERVSSAGDNTILLIQDETGRDLRPGMRVFSNEGISLMMELREKLKPEVVVKYFALEEESIGANYARANIDAGWKLYFGTDRKVRDTVLETKTLLAKEIGTKINRLDYIDLRVPARAYYKLR